ncbi:hypothetical protein FAZ78_20460 [Cereibacter changlensis]|uniref:Uncharacterized protein n=1 Tax=Cereibacter changlensis TaxID=402884 RepID=A0A4U0YQM6_9RHOB|nr:hypothetical protein [Cereibacter changlensis]TKA94772.1 hypothetical protein FAZ78_20460 [Cereibacter changlensis]
MTTPHPADNSTIPQLDGYKKTVTKGEIAFFLGLILVVAGVSGAVMTWGVIALAMTGLALVPVVLIALVLVTFG